VAFAASITLGASVGQRPWSALDRAGAHLRGRGVRLAAVFTALGRWWTLAPLLAVGFLFAAASHASLRPVGWLALSQVASQAAAGLLKLRLRRPRPSDPLLTREPDWSYPSGHATTAVVFFIGGAIVLAGDVGAPEASRAVLTVVLIACAAGIAWSRLVLRAHYATDVTSGLLFGTGWLCASLAVATMHVPG